MGSDRSWEDLLDMTSNKPEPTDRRRLILGVGWTLHIFLLCLFLPAENWAWARGWLFFVVVVGTSILIILYLRRVNPDVIAARVNRHGGTKGWDRIVPGIFIPMMVMTVPVAALDDSRFHWSHVPWWVCVLGYVLLVAGLAGMTWAESVNRFFEPTVRIQTDHGHRGLGSSPGNTCPMGWDFLNCLFPPCWGGLSPQTPFHGGNRHGLSGYFVYLGHAM
jgi:hypothetical protein